MIKNRLTGYRWRQRFAPARGLRRYFFLALAGLIVLEAGVLLSFRFAFKPVTEGMARWWFDSISHMVPLNSMNETNHILGFLLMVAGGSALYFGVTRGIQRLKDGDGESGRTDAVSGWRRKQILAAGPRIVAIGGGTGLSTLLRGLKQYSSNITAIVTVTDDGGSSGRLVQEMGIIPPGDIRNCLVALADAEKLMTDLFQHRFQKKSGSLSGHSVGNLLIAGFIEQADGDIDLALEMASDVLAIRGKVVPSTKDHVRLRALMDDQTEICGETAIVGSGKRVRRIYVDPSECTPHPSALEAIAEAELICIGPGSVYTSVIPNLLVPGIADALAASVAPKAYVCNVMTQRGESEAFTAAEHLVAIQANVTGKVVDFVVINTGVPTEATLEKYRDFQQELVVPDFDRVATMGYRPIIGDFMSEMDYVRHDPVRLAAKLMDLV
ncbi:MAG: YvcK family protein [Armatimonadetes bacterium]|nr:YvcK family protein [Armatimonadota bacterium]